MECWCLLCTHRTLCLYPCCPEGIKGYCGVFLTAAAVLWCWLPLQEREEATKAYGTLEQQQQAGNTFEPGEGLPEPAAAAEADGGEAAADGAEDAAAAEAAVAAKPMAAPTAEQLTAIKAAVANAQTLEDAWRLEQSLKAGDMPSALERKELEQQQQQPQDGPDAMEEG